MANKTQTHLAELAENGDATAAALADAYERAMQLKPKTDSEVSALRKTRELVPAGPGRDAIDAEIEARSMGDSEDALAELREIFEQVAAMTTKTVSHGYVKAIGKMIGDWRYGKKDDSDE